MHVSKPMGSKPTQSNSNTSVVKQSESTTTTTTTTTGSSESVFKRPAVEQQPSSDNKLESTKVKDAPVVQQSLFESADSTQEIPGISPQLPSKPPLHEPPPPLPPTSQSSSGNSASHSLDSNKKKDTKEKEEELSWSPPPPEPQQKPLSIPLSSDAQVPFGATPTQKPSFSERIQAGAKETSESNIQSETPFQSQFIQSKKAPFKSETRAQPGKEHKANPSQNTDGFSVNNQSQQGSSNTQFGRKRTFPPTNKWIKNEKYTRRSDPAPSPMQIEYEQDPKVDRSILDAEPKEIIKKFTNRCRLFVGGILDADEKLMKDMFTKFGAISELWLNKEKGFGFVKMDTRPNAQRAIDHYNGIERSNSMLRVRFAARSSSIKVSNLSFAVTNELLEDAFKTFGEVEHAVVACDERGKSLGWGVVDFAMKKSATYAISRCKEGIFLLCKSPIPVMVTELKDEDLEEGVVEKTVYKNVLYQREREDGPRFSMPGSLEYQMGLKWKDFLEKARTERELLEESLKAERVKLEDETEAGLIHYLEQQTRLQHQEELRRQDEARRVDESKRQDYLRQHEMIKQETRRRSQTMKMQEDLKRREESLLKDSDYNTGNPDHGYNRQYGQMHPSDSSYGYPSQDYEHGYGSAKAQQDWASSGGSYQKEWGTESNTGYGGGSGYHSNQSRNVQSGYDEYPGYSTQYEQGYDTESYNKDQYGSRDQYRGNSRGYTGASQQSTGSYGNIPAGANSNLATGSYSSSGGYGTSSSQAQTGSSEQAWNYGQGGQGSMYDSGYGDHFGDNVSAGGGGGNSYDRRRPLSEDISGRMGYPGSEKRRKY